MTVMRDPFALAGLALCATLMSACAAAPAPQKPSTPDRGQIIPRPSASVAAKPEPPPMSGEAATAVLLTDAEAWSDAKYHPERHAAFFAERALDDVAVRRLLAALGGPCLATSDRASKECESLRASKGDAGEAVDVMFDWAAELASIDVQDTRTVAILVQLNARGLWEAEVAMERVLERRMLSGLGSCDVPSEAELGAAREALTGLWVKSPGAPPRLPTDAERADVAYFRVVMAQSGSEVGQPTEDVESPGLPKDDAAIEKRQALRQRMDRALLAGEIAEHALAAEAYLSSLGYPGPIRVNEEQDARWGGRGYAYVMRDWARSAEILGQYETAEALYRQAPPGGGFCGTSVDSLRIEQMEGAIRCGEQSAGCRRAAADRLFAPGSAFNHAYGPQRLTDAGFDVGRIYTGALLSARTEIDQSNRVRAIPGYADSRGAAALPALLSIAKDGRGEERAEAVRVIGALLKSRGLDPCNPSRRGFGGTWGRGARVVTSIMDSCDTVLKPEKVRRVVQQVAQLAGDPDPALREIVADTLGQTASPAARPALQVLAQDRYDAGGEVCVSTNGGPSVCGPNLPVKDAAETALKALKDAAEVRAEQRRANAEASRE